MIQLSQHWLPLLSPFDTRGSLSGHMSRVDLAATTCTAFDLQSYVTARYCLKCKYPRQIVSITLVSCESMLYMNAESPVLSHTREKV